MESPKFIQTAIAHQIIANVVSSLEMEVVPADCIDDSIRAEKNGKKSMM